MPGWWKPSPPELSYITLHHPSSGIAFARLHIHCVPCTITVNRRRNGIARSIEILVVKWDRATRGERWCAAVRPPSYKFCVLLWCLLPRCNEARSSWRVYYLAHNAFPSKGKKKHIFLLNCTFHFFLIFFEQTTNSKSLHLCPIWGQKKKKVLHGLFFIRFTKKGRLVTPSSAKSMTWSTCIAVSLLLLSSVPDRTRRRRTAGRQADHLPYL